MIAKILLTLICFSLAGPALSFASEKDEHAEHADHDDHDEHRDHDDHDEHGDHDHHENEGPTEFTLTTAAVQNFGLNSVRVTAKNPITIPESAVVTSLENKMLYRRRGDQYRAINFKVVKTSASQITVQSAELQDGDEIITTGVAFLRVAELAAGGGLAHGHSH